jgi:hypothetical protein
MADFSDISVKEAAMYLSAMIDGEGSVSSGVVGSVTNIRITCCTNTDEDVLDATTECLDVLGVPWQRYDGSPRPPWKPCSHIVVHGRQNIIRLATHLNLRSAHKRDRIHAALTASAKTRPTHEHLRQLFESGLSLEKIAAQFGVSQSSVSRWFLGSGFVRRQGSVGVRNFRGKTAQPSRGTG